jgi:glycerol-1-phosphate dehydrogenase [NAD(P)+]
MEAYTIHRMQLPREVLIGKGVLKHLRTICKRLGFKSSVTILTGPQVVEIVANEVLNQLEREGFQATLSLVDEANVENVEKSLDIFNKFKPDFILGIGGGKVIDVAKIASSKNNLPFISIPTALSHDGISSSRASIKGLTGSTSIEAQAPIAIIGDVQIISKSPFRLTASGCGDIVSKHTAIKDWKLAHRVKGDYYGEYAANLALMSAELVMKHAKTISEEKDEGFRVVLEALISCGVAMSIAGSSRPCSGSEHLFSHALDIITPKAALHGEQCGVGAIMMAYLWKADWKLLKNKLKTIGAPTTAEELGIQENHIIEALIMARTIRPERYTILHTQKLTQQTAQAIAQKTGII